MPCPLPIVSAALLDLQGVMTYPPPPLPEDEEEQEDPKPGEFRHSITFTCHIGTHCQGSHALGWHQLQAGERLPT